MNISPINNDAWDDYSFSHTQGSVEHSPKWKETTSWRDPFLTEPYILMGKSGYILSLYKQTAP